MNDYPTSPGDCYIDQDDVDAPLLLDAETSANFVASLISSFTGDEVDGDGDPWSIVCEHLSTLLGNLGAALARPEASPILDHLYDEYGLSPNDLRTDEERAREVAGCPHEGEEVATIATGVALFSTGANRAVVEWNEAPELTVGQRVALIALPDFVKVVGE